MRKSALIAFIILVFSPTAEAHNFVPLLAQSPCGWFVKTAPNVWSSTQVINLDMSGLVIGQLSFGPGTYRVDDGTDAYELIERKCGRGPVPPYVYRPAVLFPFDLLPWNQ